MLPPQWAKEKHGLYPYVLAFDDVAELELLAAEAAAAAKAVVTAKEEWVPPPPDAEPETFENE